MLGKENIKQFLFTDNIIAYIEKPKESTKIVFINIKWASWGQCKQSWYIKINYISR